MLRLFLIVLAWPLAVLLIVSGVLWYRAVFPEPPREIVLEPVRVQAAQRTAASALERLRALPPVEQHRLVAAMQEVLEPPADWLWKLSRTDYRILCLGEHHEPSTRRFLAETFFTRYSVDVLLLEATPEERALIEQWMEEGRDYVPLLDADIGAVLRAVRGRNPDVLVRGIEETRAQVATRKEREGSRDLTLARNFWQSWQPGQRNVILYGALHCADDSTWLYRHLREQMPAREGVPMRNIRIIGTHQHAPTLAFATFLQALDMGRGDFVLTDTEAVPSPLRRWFDMFDQHVLKRYATLAVYRLTSEELDASGMQRINPVANAPGSEDVLPQWVPAR